MDHTDVFVSLETTAWGFFSIRPPDGDPDRYIQSFDGRIWVYDDDVNSEHTIGHLSIVRFDLGLVSREFGMEILDSHSGAAASLIHDLYVETEWMNDFDVVGGDVGTVWYVEKVRLLPGCRGCGFGAVALGTALRVLTLDDSFSLVLLKPFALDLPEETPETVRAAANHKLREHWARLGFEAVPHSPLNLMALSPALMHWWQGRDEGDLPTFPAPNQEAPN